VSQIEEIISQVAKLLDDAPAETAKEKARSLFIRGKAMLAAPSQMAGAEENLSRSV